jgi:hypothetical protein
MALQRVLLWLASMGLSHQLHDAALSSSKVPRNQHLSMGCSPHVPRYGGQYLVRWIPD